VSDFQWRLHRWTIGWLALAAISPVLFLLLAYGMAILSWRCIFLCGPLLRTATYYALNITLHLSWVAPLAIVGTLVVRWLRKELKKDREARARQKAMKEEAMERVREAAHAMAPSVKTEIIIRHILSTPGQQRTDKGEGSLYGAKGESMWPER
jgi:membrane protein implicated in regulation of membrane protease activity